MSTIQDVAKLAGVSVATVSRVINNSPSVSQETKDLVNQTIQKLNYRPNLLGRNLRRSETRMILVLLPTLSNPIYSRIVKGIEDIAHKDGYNVLLCDTRSDLSRERNYIDLLRNRLADGVIFMSPILENDTLSHLGKGFPVVQCCEYKEGTDVPYVSIDNFAAAYKAVKHLIGLGHKRIAFLGTRFSLNSASERESGYLKALADHRIQPDPALIKYGDYSFKSGLRAGTQLLDLPERPTAVFAISDLMAIGIIRSALASNIRIPEELAVVGFDNISFSSMYAPSLTTISQPLYDLGASAMELLLKQIRAEAGYPQSILLEHELLIRESTVK